MASKKTSKKAASAKKAPKATAPAKAARPRAGALGELPSPNVSRRVAKRAAELRSSGKSHKQAMKQAWAEEKAGRGGKMLPARRQSSAPAKAEPAPSATASVRRSTIGNILHYIAPWSAKQSASMSAPALAEAAAIVSQTAKIYDGLADILPTASGNATKNEHAAVALEAVVEPIIAGALHDLPNVSAGVKRLVARFFKEKNMGIMRQNTSSGGNVPGMGFVQGLADFVAWLPVGDRIALTRHVNEFIAENNVTPATPPTNLPEPIREAWVLSAVLATMFGVPDRPMGMAEVAGIELGGRGGRRAIAEVGMGWPAASRHGAPGFQYGNTDPDTIADVRASLPMMGAGASPADFDLFLTLDNPFALSAPLGVGPGFHRQIRPADAPTLGPPALFGNGPNGNGNGGNSANAPGHARAAQPMTDEAAAASRRANSIATASGRTLNPAGAFNPFPGGLGMSIGDDDEPEASFY